MGKRSTVSTESLNKKTRQTCWDMRLVTGHVPGWLFYVAVNVSFQLSPTWSLGLKTDINHAGILTTIQRSRTRKAYGIDGDIASDCVRSTCCCCCTLIQNEKEVVKREDKRSRVALERGATLTSPYIAPTPMTFPPPPK
jgi:Cys-rich protein (TIGR01571 family)